MISRRLAVSVFWLVFGIPFIVLFVALWVVALFPGTFAAFVLTGEAENAWVICAPLIALADGLGDWASGDGRPS